MKPIDYKKELENQCGPDCDCVAQSEQSAIDTSAEPEGDEAPADCGPSCDCNAPAPRSPAKIAVAILVLTAAAAILVVKLVGNADTPAPGNDQPGVESNSPSPALPAVKTLGSFLELNTAAAKVDAVLVIVPAKDEVRVKEEISRSVEAARQKLAAKAMTVGVYSLRTDSPDYSALAGRHALPGVVVFAGGGGTDLVSGKNYDSGMLTGNITESKLLQAYVAASLGSSGGGCDCAPGASCEDK